MTPDQVLDAAADLYDTGQNKWIQGRLYDNDGGVCMSQALWIAAGRPHLSQNQNRIQDYNAYVQARAFVSTRLEAPYCTIPEWNDDLDRTEEEVVDKLRSLAKEYREEQGNV